MKFGGLLARKGSKLIDVLDNDEMSPEDYIKEGLKELAKLVVEYGDRAYRNFNFCSSDSSFMQVVEYIRNNFPESFELVEQSPCQYRDACESSDRGECILREGYESIIKGAKNEGYIKRELKKFRKRDLSEKKNSHYKRNSSGIGTPVYPDSMFFGGEVEC